MDDLISREDAIRWVKTECNPYGKPTLDFENGKKVIEHLEQMPSAQPEQRWIPCSERLPEVGQDILMSVGGMYTAEGCLREDGDWEQFRWDTIQRKDMVGAWMPLPEPYEAESEDKE